MDPKVQAQEIFPGTVETQVFPGPETGLTPRQQFLLKQMVVFFYGL